MLKTNRIKWVIFTVLVLLLVGSLIVPGCAKPAPAPTPTPAPTPAPAPKVLKWRMQTLDSVGSGSWETIVGEFARYVKTLSNGELEITPYPDGAIVKSTDILTALGNRVVEMAFDGPGNWEATIPEAGALTLPMAAPSWLEQIIVSQDYGFLPILRDAYAKHKVYFLNTVNSGSIWMWFKPEVRSLADIKGKKVRFFGLCNTLMGKLGASVVSIAHAESYMALQLGTVDAYGSGINRYLDLKHYELAKYFIRTPAFAGSALELIMNLDAWNELPDRLKTLLQLAALNFEYHYGRYFNNRDKVFFYKEAAQYKVTLVDLPDEDILKIRKAAAEIWDDVAKKSPGAAKMVQISKDYLGIK